MSRNFQTSVFINLAFIILQFKFVRQYTSMNKFGFFNSIQPKANFAFGGTMLLEILPKLNCIKYSLMINILGS